MHPQNKRHNGTESVLKSSEHTSDYSRDVSTVFWFYQAFQKVCSNVEHCISGTTHCHVSMYIFQQRLGGFAVSSLQ